MNKTILAGIAALGIAANAIAADPNVVKSLAAYVNSSYSPAACDYNGRIVSCNLDVITVRESISHLRVPLDVRVATFTVDGRHYFQTERPLSEYGSAEVLRTEHNLDNKAGDVDSATSFLPDGRFVRQDVSIPKTFFSIQSVDDFTIKMLQREVKMEMREHDRPNRKAIQ